MRPRVIYMGTPDFAVPALQCLASSDLCEVVLVVTQPDRPAGRGKKLVSPPVKVAADELELPLVQTGTLRNPDVRRRIIELAPDLIVVAAFGMILGRWILDLPTHGCVNLHASLLPQLRGANPIASAIAKGDAAAGITLMRMDRGLDTGPVYATASIQVDGDDTTESLTRKLADLAGNLLTEHLADLLDGGLEAMPQEAGATLTRMMTKADGWLNYSRPAVDLERHIRAMWSWPRAWTTAQDGIRIQIHAADISENYTGEPGRIAHRNKHVHVGTGHGSLVLRRVQLPGGKPIEGAAILAVSVLTEDSILGADGGPEDIPPLVIAVVNDL